MTGVWRETKHIARTFGVILFVALLCFGSFWFGLQIAKARPRPIPSVVEIQEMVGAVPDGVMGPETLAKWDLAICQQSADEWNYMYEELK